MQNWGSITVESDRTGISLMNTVWKVLYRKASFPDNVQTCCIKELGFLDDAFNFAGEQVQSIWIGYGKGTGELVEGAIIHDGPDRKTVRARWSAGVESEISIFPGMPVLRVDYKTYGVNDVDFVNLGTYVIHGADAWQQERLRYPLHDGGDNPHHAMTHDLYPSYPNPFLDTPDWPAPVNQSCLSYRGWMILGLTDGGRGYGRLVRASAVPYIKLLWNKGFEFFPFWRAEMRPYTGYIFIVKGGPEALIAYGKQVADWVNDGECPSEAPCGGYSVSVACDAGEKPR